MAWHDLKIFRQQLEMVTDALKTGLNRHAGTSCLGNQGSLPHCLELGVLVMLGNTCPLMVKAPGAL